jgi:hypothetical protein
MQATSDPEEAINTPFFRVALLFFYLKRHARLPWYAGVVAVLLPVSAIVTGLTALNLERAVFNVMGGLRETGTANDETYAVLFMLSLFAVILLVPLVIAYVVIIAIRSSKEDVPKVI